MSSILTSKKLNKFINLVHSWVTMKEVNGSFDYKKEFNDYLPELEEYIYEGKGLRSWKYSTKDFKKISKNFDEIKVPKNQFYSFYKDEGDVEEFDLINKVNNDNHTVAIMCEVESEFIDIVSLIFDLNDMRDDISQDNVREMIDELYFGYCDEQEILLKDEMTSYKPIGIYSSLDIHSDIAYYEKRENKPNDMVELKFEEFLKTSPLKEKKRKVKTKS